jgi:hypothetical protein
MRVLLIDDDQKLARLLVKGLEEGRFVVDVAHTGGSGEEMASVNRYELLCSIGCCRTGVDWQCVWISGRAGSRPLS